MYRQVLDYQADRIEDVLFSHKLPTRVNGGLVTPRFVRFRLSVPMGAKVRQVANLAEEMALSLGVPSCRVFRQGGDLHVEVPREQGKVVRLVPLCRRLSEVPAHTAILGLDELGAPLLLRLSSPDVAHVLIAGTTGSGKTELARAMIASLALFNRQSDLQMVLIDPKLQGFAPFNGLAHLLCPVVRRVEEALAVLLRLTAEMERRDAQGCDRPRVIVFVDELADLVGMGGRPVEDALTRLTQRGRSAGIHVVACTQKPTAAVIGSLVKSNFPVRVVGSVTSPEDAKVSTGIAGTGAERLLGRGDFLLVAKGQVVRLQGAYIPKDEIAQLVGGSLRREQPIRLLSTPETGGGWMPRLVQKVAGGIPRG
jgi:S-DNA-T family DNA segregation ATPase FtsK/SpoIIIE